MMQEKILHIVSKNMQMDFMSHLLSPMDYLMSVMGGISGEFYGMQSIL